MIDYLRVFFVGDGVLKSVSDHERSNRETNNKKCSKHYKTSPRIHNECCVCVFVVVYLCRNVAS
jgi:hypothetical protein